MSKNGAHTWCVHIPFFVLLRGPSADSRRRRFVFLVRICPTVDLIEKLLAYSSTSLPHFPTHMAACLTCAFTSASSGGKSGQEAVRHGSGSGSRIKRDNVRNNLFEDEMIALVFDSWYRLRLIIFLSDLDNTSFALRDTSSHVRLLSFAGRYCTLPFSFVLIITWPFCCENTSSEVDKAVLPDRVRSPALQVLTAGSREGSRHRTTPKK